MILKLNTEKSITFLVSSHILDGLSRIATYYGFIENGRIIKEISAKELEKEVRKSLRVEVNNIKALSRVLDCMNTEYKILSEKEADIYAEIEISELVSELKKEDCKILSVTRHNENLESYYINLTGGYKNV